MIAPRDCDLHEAVSRLDRGPPAAPSHDGGQDGSDGSRDHGVAVADDGGHTVSSSSTVGDG
jgi:hypothetical protein